MEINSANTPKNTLQVHYPFGMMMLGRTWSSESGYRFGFQGQEGDDEINGSGNSINYKYRMHDSRICRFFSVDPLFNSFPWNSPYAFSENMVTAHIELEGLESVFNITYQAIHRDSPKLANNPDFQKGSNVANMLGFSFTPFGLLIDGYDFFTAASQRDGVGMLMAGIGLFAFGDFAKIPGKMMRITSEAANAKYVAKGYDAPYKVGSEVMEFTTSEAEQFVRVYKKGDNNAEGAFMMKKTDLLDTDGNMLSPADIQDKFSLDYMPDHVVDVNVPANTKMITGTAAGRKNVSNGVNTNGGGRQFELDMDIDPSYFTNQRSLDQL